ncbi:MAG: hypothetical protein KC766_21655 [Myxococcales bacterium]|nr:hypothetical protein [Myxococcales bacterium]
MANLSRRGFLGLFRQESSKKADAEEFSLDSFYAKRGKPPTSLNVELRRDLPAVETTQVGVPDLIPKATKSDE